MKITFNPVTKCFAVLTHYTNGSGAKGVVNSGNYNYTQKYGPSFFEDSDDYIRNNKSDMYRTMKLVRKFKKNNKQFNVDNLAALNLNNCQASKRYNLVDDIPETISFDPEFFPMKSGVHYPREIGQAWIIDGINRDSKDKINPIYRLVSETKNDNDIYTVLNLPEQRTDNSNIKSTKIEIPKGMYDSEKRIKREYINDYKDFKDTDFNRDDESTNSALNDIVKKNAFLNKGHGKRK